MQAGSAVALSSAGSSRTSWSVRRSAPSTRPSFRPDPGPAGARELVAAWTALARRQAVRLNPLRALAGLVGLSDHLVYRSALRRLIDQWVPIDRIEEATRRWR